MKKFQGKKIHILGVAGTLMGSFAAFLKRNGIDVTGSDENIYPPISDLLKESDVKVYSPFGPKNIDQVKPDLVIVGNVIRKTNPEMEYVEQQKIPYLSLPATFEEMLLPDKHPIVVAGTHGKTTTASMMAWMLECLKEDPSFFVGGVLKNFPESLRVKDSKYFVLEGDEYDTAFFDKVPKFVHYLPKDIVLTSIEYDHADIYPDMQSVISAFSELSKLAPPNGFFIVCGESETPLRIAHESRAQVISYGLSASVDSKATKIQESPDGTTFVWEINGEHHKVQTTTTGKHNVLNILSCLTLAHARKWDLEKAVNAFKTYGGVKRRQEVYADVANIKLIDDFAHHPTAVRETVCAMKQRYPDSRIIACFEPRSATSRRSIFQKAYQDAFDGADLVYIAKPYDQSRIPKEDQFSTEKLIEDLNSKGKRAKILSTSDEEIKKLAGSLKETDVVLVMSNGGFDGLLPKLKSALSRTK